jgi:hypothetical protein
MRFILRILAAPLWGLFSLVVALSTFLLSFAGFFLWIVSLLVGLAGVVMLFTHQVAGGIAFLVIAFLLSPFGLVTLMARLVNTLEDARCFLRAFVMS